MGNVPETVTLLRRRQGSRSSTHAAALRESSHQEVARYLSNTCSHATAEDVAVLWGNRLPSTQDEATLVVTVLDSALEGVGKEPSSVRRFCEEDCRKRKAALTCSCLASG